MRTNTNFELSILDSFCDEYEAEFLKSKSTEVSPKPRLRKIFSRLDSRASEISNDLASEIRIEIFVIELQHSIAHGKDLSESCQELLQLGMSGILEAEVAMAASIALATLNEEKTEGDRLISGMATGIRGTLSIEEKLFARTDGVKEKQWLGRYEIIKRIGAGGFGVVFQAFDPMMRRQVAIKIPRLSILGDETARKLLEEETSTLSRLRHPGIVTAYHAEEIDGYFCLVYEFIDGTNLQQWIDSRPNSPEIDIVVDIAIQLCDALEHAHSRGVIHRDIKPSNILVSQDGNSVLTTKLTDFGLAKILQEKQVHSTSFAAAGTLAYTSPERLARNSTGSASCDIYSLGVILFRLLSGRLPFSAEIELDLLNQIVEEQAPEIHNLVGSVPTDLSAIVSMCLMKSSLERYQSVCELKADLVAFQDGSPVKARTNGIRGKLRHWARGKRRISEAALFSLALNISLILWSVIFVPIYYTFELFDPSDVPQISDLIKSSLLMSLLCCVPMSWGSIKILRGKLIYLVPTLVVALSNVVLMIMFLVGIMEIDFGGLYQNRSTRSTAFALLITLMTIQVIGFAVAIYSSKQQNTHIQRAAPTNT
jgi:serine/threonine protein kinase